MQKFNRIAIALSLCASLATGSVWAVDTGGVDMTAVSMVAAVAAPAAFIAGGASYQVKNVEASADGTVYQLDKSGVSGTITVVGSALGELLLNAGATIKANAVAEGVLLISDDQVLALVPAKLVK
ncbi:hypothetical protein CAter282_0077 [Collimonas arenae]|uniref:Uncharacterized protein n=1 Tax=Collimonas arenae TaxID=279058 RepID=A0A127QD20_9BURK|nr:hypothetical protein [Collimonas arenae]AMO98039.1 hypothetical protein CAter10_0081 [Collimonas arenae]AMP07901.1 hypothetical protein CAter282_0077 [Collimonas arenae]